MRIALFIFVTGCAMSFSSKPSDTDVSETLPSADAASVRMVGVQWVGTVIHNGFPRAVFYSFGGDWKWADTNTQVPPELDKRLCKLRSLELARAVEGIDAKSRELALQELAGE